MLPMVLREMALEYYSEFVQLGKVKFVQCTQCAAAKREMEQHCKLEYGKRHLRHIGKESGVRRY